MNTFQVPQRIKELIDVCHDGVDDSHSDEMRELGDWLNDNPEGRFVLSKSLAFDEQVKSAIVDVPVPSGLTGKIREFLEENQTQTAAASNQSGVQENVDESTKRSGRRRFFLVGGSAGVVVATLIGVLVYNLYYQPELESVSWSQLCGDGQEWHDAVDDLDWKPVKVDSDFKKLNQRLAECSDLVIAPERWSKFQSRFGETAAYVSKLPGGKRVYQFTFRADDRKFAFNLPQLLPQAPQYPGNRFCVAVCQKGDLVHVVVVEGDPADYKKMLKERYDFA